MFHRTVLDDGPRVISARLPDGTRISARVTQAVNQGPAMLLTLAAALYLTVIELREMEPTPHYAWWIWWLLLVFMTHFIGYLFLRAYAVYRRWNLARG